MGDGHKYALPVQFINGLGDTNVRQQAIWTEHVYNVGSERISKIVLLWLKTLIVLP